MKEYLHNIYKTESNCFQLGYENTIGFKYTVLNKSYFSIEKLESTKKCET